jgi:hypothetical protein
MGIKEASNQRGFFFYSNLTTTGMEFIEDGLNYQSRNVHGEILINHLLPFEHSTGPYPANYAQVSFEM